MPPSLLWTQRFGWVLNQVVQCQFNRAKRKSGQVGRVRSGPGAMSSNTLPACAAAGCLTAKPRSL